jgi:hypothetical protein
LSDRSILASCASKVGRTSLFMRGTAVTGSLGDRQPCWDRGAPRPRHSGCSSRSRSASRPCRRPVEELTKKVSKATKLPVRGASMCRSRSSGEKRRCIGLTSSNQGHSFAVRGEQSAA